MPRRPTHHRATSGRLLQGQWGPLVKVSAKSMRLRFIQCGPDCIKNGCTAKCCDAPTHPDGIRVYVHPDEEKPLRAFGVKISKSFLMPQAGCRLCPFKTEDHLCGLFGHEERPFGCIASPFMLNQRDTLIVRNRYKMLPCYQPTNGDFAYRVFRTSLVAIFGEQETAKIEAHLQTGGDDLRARPLWTAYLKLNRREGALHA